MKIVFLSEHVGFVNRGVETYVLELSKRLSKNHQVEILTGRSLIHLKKLLTVNMIW